MCRITPEIQKDFSWLFYKLAPRENHLIKSGVVKKEKSNIIYSKSMFYAENIGMGAHVINNFNKFLI